MAEAQEGAPQIPPELLSHLNSLPYVDRQRIKKLSTARLTELLVKSGHDLETIGYPH